MRAKKVQAIETASELPMKILTEPLEIRQILDRAAEGTVAVDVQIKGLVGRKYRFRMIDRPTKGEFIYLEPEKPSELLEFRKQLDECLSRECLLLLFIKGRFLIGLTSSPARDKGPELRVPVPPRICRIQRRKESRYQFPAGYEIFVEMQAIEGGARVVKKQLYDLSRSGLGFTVVSPREAGLFKPGTVLKDVKFTVQGRSIQVDVVVRSRIPADPKTGRPSVIGTEFFNIDPVEENFITAFIALWDPLESTCRHASLSIL